MSERDKPGAPTPAKADTTARVEGMSDGVFAVALILLVLDIKVPDAAPGALGGAVLGMAPRFGAFAVSFLIVGYAWVWHHLTFAIIERSTRTLLWINLVALLPVAVILVTGLTVIGPGTLTDLALALFVGIAVGAYSSIFLAAPMFAQMKQGEPDVEAHDKRLAKRLAKAERAASHPAEARAAALAAPPERLQARR